MPEVQYPVGYGTSTVTMDELEAKYGPNAPIPAHPEYWRRIKAWLISRGGAMGIGGAYRYTQPQKPGFAPPGMSFHEKQTFASGLQVYSAIDLVVGVPGKVHRAPSWSEVPQQGSGHPDIQAFGLHCNVGGEPWHIQCFEIDGYSSWKNAGRKDPRTNYPIQGETPPPPPPPPPSNSRTPLPTLKLGSKGTEVRKLQDTCNFWGWGDVGKADGNFGPRTEDGVKEMQKAIGASVDGVYGPKTQDALEAFLKAMDELASGGNTGGGGDQSIGKRTLKVQTPKMRGEDVTWVQNTLKNQGLSITVDGWYGNETKQRVMTMQGWNNLTRDGIVGPKTWDVLKQY